MAVLQSRSFLSSTRRNRSDRSDRVRLVAGNYLSMFIATQHSGGDWRHGGPAAAMAEPTWMTRSDTTLSIIDALRKAYSITSSAINCMELGTVRPSVLAVFILMTN